MIRFLLILGLVVVFVMSGQPVCDRRIKADVYHDIVQMKQNISFFCGDTRACFSDRDPGAGSSIR